MRSEALLLYFTLLQIAGAGFPEDSEPISISHGNCKYIIIFFSSPFSLFFFPCVLSFLSLPVRPHSLPALPLLSVLHSESSPPPLLTNSLTCPLLLLLDIPLNPLLPVPPSTLTRPLLSMRFEGVECNLVPKDRLSLHAKMKDLKQYLKRSPPRHQRIIHCFSVRGP